MAEALDSDFTELLGRDAYIAAAATVESEPPKAIWLDTLVRLLAERRGHTDDRPQYLIEELIAEIDLAVCSQVNAILHAPEFQQLEATWRGVWMLIRASEEDDSVKIKCLDANKRDLTRALRKFRGGAWDKSPLFERIYEEEFGQLGGEPYGLLIGDYSFDHRADDVMLLRDLGKIAAAAHAPFIAAAASSLLQMDSWSEVGNPRDLSRIFSTPEYVSWNALREEEDTRYIGLCMPRFLARLPYGARTNPVPSFAFEEMSEGTNTDRLLWGNAAFAFGANVVRAFVTYGWCVRIRGIDRGGIVEGLPVLHHPTADGDVDRRTVTEICLSERRDAELAMLGLIPLVHRKNSDVAAFISAQSLQKPPAYEDPFATENANLSSRLPYLLACCRFAHYLKRMVRDKVGSSMTQSELTAWLSAWLIGYVDGAPATSTEEFKAAHPLAEARVVLTDREEMPGYYDAKFFLRPHYQLERASVTLRLVSHVVEQ
jgi:type VI secretion system protein ImpC